MRIRISDILEMLAENVSVNEILEDFPDLKLEISSLSDIRCKTH